MNWLRIVRPFGRAYGEDRGASRSERGFSALKSQGARSSQPETKPTGVPKR